MVDRAWLTVRLLAADEGPLLSGLIRRCYGKTYIDPTFYDHDAVGELLSTGALHSIGAFVAPGDLVGHMGITARPWGGNTADAGMTLVDPAHRGKGIARQVAVGLAEQSVALGLVGVHDYPVTVHAATQRLAKGYGADTGLMLANMPADVSFENMETPAGGARSSSIIRWLPFGRAPRREVYLPHRYQAQLMDLYEEARLDRRARSAPGNAGREASTLEVKHDSRRQITRLASTRIGSDLLDRVVAETRVASDVGAVVAHVDLPLCDPGAPAAVEALRPHGYSFAGLLPEYREGDVLRLQWLSPEATASAAAVLSSEETRAIEAFVLHDRADLHVS